MKRQVCAILALSVMMTSACSTVQPVRSGRSGLFDEWSKLDGPRRLSDEDEAGEISRPEGMNEERLAELKRFTSRWDWPLRRVRVTSPFGERDGESHEGIDLKAGVGTPVYASDAGIITYSGRKIRGYGKMVVIKHGKALSTVYAHNSSLLVKKGQRVRKGQKIALTGATGKVSGPHLHFEVRHGVVAVDPRLLLAEPGAPTAEHRSRITRSVASSR